MSLTHAFVSGKPDGVDASLVRPSNWNAPHVGTIDYSQLPAGGGIWANGGDLNLSGGALIVGTDPGGAAMIRGQSTLTGSANDPVLDLVQVANTTGQVRPIRLLLTDTASDPTSYLLSFHTGITGAGPTSANRRLQVTKQGGMALFSDGPPPGAEATYQGYCYSNSLTGPCLFTGVKIHGSQGSPSAILDTENLVGLAGEGYDGTTYSGPQAMITFTTQGDWTPSNHGTRMAFKTTPQGSTTLAIVGWFTAAGAFNVGGFIDDNNANTLNALANGLVRVPIGPFIVGVDPSGSDIVRIAGSARLQGRLGIGAASIAAAVILVQTGQLTSGASQYGILSTPTFSSQATGFGAALYGSVSTPALAFTMATAYGLRIDDVTLGAGSAVTTQVGVQVQDQTKGGTNYAIRTGLGLVQFGDAVKTIAGLESTGAGSAVLSTNCPAVTVTAPYKWIKMLTSDGSTVYFPVWK